MNFHHSTIQSQAQLELIDIEHSSILHDEKQQQQKRWNNCSEKIGMNVCWFFVTLMLTFYSIIIIMVQIILLWAWVMLIPTELMLIHTEQNVFVFISLYFIITESYFEVFISGFVAIPLTRHTAIKLCIWYESNRKMSVPKSDGRTTWILPSHTFLDKITTIWVLRFGWFLLYVSRGYNLDRWLFSRTPQPLPPLTHQIQARRRVHKAPCKLCHYKTIGNKLYAMPFSSFVGKRKSRSASF